MFADRLALTLVNRRQVSGNRGLSKSESGGVLMDDDTCKAVIPLGRSERKMKSSHPYLKSAFLLG